MATIGQFNNLTVIEITPFGAILDAGKGQKIFVSNKHLSDQCQPGSRVNVFLYQDVDGKVAGTCEPPKAKVGEFARLTVVEVNKVGAFLDWGLPKDLFVPFGEQFRPLKEGQSPVVYVYNNNADGRTVASTKVDKFLDNLPADYRVGDQVTIVVFEKTDLGHKVIINHQHSGMIHFDDIHRPLKYGQRLTAFIKNIRADKKIDVALQKPGEAGRQDLASRILDALNDSGGQLMLSDKSSPETIKKVFGVRKKQFKEALGKLYKEKKILIDKDHIKSI